MKAKLLDIQGKEKGKIELPECFSQPVREDIISKVLETKKTKQPYAPSLLAGKQHSAKGKIVHRRHVWKSQYGRGISRVPRKIFVRRGSQFIWEAAEVPQARGGMRAHPPKTVSMINTKRINKKELKIAMLSALSATANKEWILKKYESLKNEELGKMELPFVVESKITSLKTKDLISSMKKILGEKLFNIALRKKSVRSGKGKLRGRKYKTSAGLLIVTGKDEKLKTTAFDVKSVSNLSVTDLAKGGAGRLAVYTEQAIKDINEKYGESKK